MTGGGSGQLSQPSGGYNIDTVTADLSTLIEPII